MKNLMYNSLIDFYPNKEYIIEEYQKMNLENKKIFKLYVYSRPFMDDKTKDLIWEYLNSWEEAQFDLSKKYREVKRKYDKRVANAMQYNDEIGQLE